MNWRIIIKATFLTILVSVQGCFDQVSKKSTRSDSGFSSPVLPMIAIPGERVTVTSSQLSVKQNFTVLIDGDIKIRSLVTKEGKISFAMPDGLSRGRKELIVLADNGERIVSSSIIADTVVGDAIYYAGPAEDICASQLFFGNDGKTQAGKMTCGSGEICTKNFQTDCITTSKYLSADLSNLTERNIKYGVTIGSITGKYPSVDVPLEGADSTPDLSANIATRESQLRSSSSFEFFTSSGERVVATGDADLVASNIQSGVSIFGITGSYTGDPIDPWNLRSGVTIGSVTGKLPVNCRSGTRLSTFDMAGFPKLGTLDHTTDTITVNAHGWSDGQAVKFDSSSSPGGLTAGNTYYVKSSATNSFQLSTTNGGAMINFSSNGASNYFYALNNGISDVWDTLDDSSGFASELPSGWSGQVCGGIEVSLGDDNVWRDVTTTGDGVTVSSCAATAAHCTFKDKITGQDWHKLDSALLTWMGAYDYCESLVYNGKTDWRLPTIKELLGSYQHGIVSTVGHPHWITLGDMNTSVWSVTTIDNPNSAYQLGTFYRGFTDTLEKASSGGQAICTRP